MHLFPFLLLSLLVISPLTFVQGRSSWQQEEGEQNEEGSNNLFHSPPPPPPPPPPEPMDGKVRTTLDGRLVSYLQPPYSTNHASFIEQIPGCCLIVAWFSGTSEGQNDTSIVVSSLSSSGDQFTEPILVSRRSGYSNQNPVLYYNTLTENLHLFHSQQVAAESPNENQATVWELQSQDNGTRWSTPRIVFSKAGSFDRNRIITLNNGDQWLFPLYSAAGTDSQQYSELAISNDFGETWDTNTFPSSNSLVQPTLFRQPDTINNLIGFFRDRNAEHIYQTSSSDGGDSWAKPSKTSLPNNNCAIQAIALSSGKIALVFNDVAGSNSRTPLTIALSDDNGQSWKWQRNLEPRPDNFTSSSSMEFEAFHNNHKDEPGLDYPEYSYPSLLEDDQGQIHVVYTWNRATIKYVQIDEDWIMTPDK